MYGGALEFETDPAAMEGPESSARKHSPGVKGNVTSVMNAILD